MTNKYNLPEVVVNALSSNEYVGGEGISATTLIRPPQMVTLEKRYGKDETDVIDNLWSMLGTAVHNVFEKYAEEDAVCEQRLSVEVDDVLVNGQVDHYKDKIISDYKITSAWKYVNGDFEDWETQLNIYSYLYYQNGYDVDKIQIIAVFKDWSKMQAMKGGDYPDAPIKVIELPLWDLDDTEEYIRNRVVNLRTCENLTDSKLIRCTDKDRWATPTKYAVMKRGNKRAVKLYDTLLEAQAHESQASNLYVEIRPGESKRCAEYCPVASKCHQWKEMQNV